MYDPRAPLRGPLSSVQNRIYTRKNQDCDPIASASKFQPSPMSYMRPGPGASENDYLYAARSGNPSFQDRSLDAGYVRPYIPNPSITTFRPSTLSREDEILRKLDLYQQKYQLEPSYTPIPGEYDSNRFREDKPRLLQENAYQPKKLTAFRNPRTGYSAQAEGLVELNVYAQSKQHKLEKCRKESVVSHYPFEPAANYNVREPSSAVGARYDRSAARGVPDASYTAQPALHRALCQQFTTRNAPSPAYGRREPKPQYSTKEEPSYLPASKSDNAYKRQNRSLSYAYHEQTAQPFLTRAQPTYSNKNIEDREAQPAENQSALRYGQHFQQPISRYTVTSSTPSVAEQQQLSQDPNYQPGRRFNNFEAPQDSQQKYTPASAYKRESKTQEENDLDRYYEDRSAKKQSLRQRSEQLKMRMNSPSPLKKQIYQSKDLGIEPKQLFKQQRPAFSGVNPKTNSVINSSNAYPEYQRPTTAGVSRQLSNNTPMKHISLPQDDEYRQQLERLAPPPPVPTTCSVNLMADERSGRVVPPQSEEETYRKIQTINELNNKINQRIKHILSSFSSDV